MPKPLIVIPADDPVQMGRSPHLERLQSRAEVQVYNDTPTTESEQVRRLADADIMINSRGHLKWSGTLLEQLPKLRMITTCSIGIDSIDIETARRLGIVVCNVPGRTATVVAEHALALMFAAARRIGYSTSEMKAGRWPKIFNTFLAGKTLGVLGTGSIGSEMIRLGKAVGMHVLAWTFHPAPQRAAKLGVDFVELDDLLARSDVVSIHVKLTPESEGLIGAAELQRMKPGSLLVNTARGAVVDQPALLEALQSGHLASAALDVFPQEPPDPDDPILTCEHIVLTPHSADRNPEGVDLLNGGATDNVLAYLDGEPQNVVT